MYLTELISNLNAMLSYHGDLIVHDADGYPIEEVSLMPDNSTDEEQSLVLYSEGDEH